MKTRHLAALAIVVACLGSALPATASTLTFEATTEFSGAQSPQGTKPWLTLTFDDNTGNSNSVYVTMEATNLVGSEFVAVFAFNFNSALDASALTITAIDDSAVANWTATPANNSFKADGDGFFDVVFDLPPPPGAFAGKLTAGESITFELTYTSAIDVSDFDYLSVNGPAGKTGFPFAAHVQGIGTDGSGSGWVTVPVPSSLPMALSLLASVGALGMVRSRWQG